jgi:hypothetical protein
MSSQHNKHPMPRLRERLFDLESDGPGLGWEAFQHHKKKRRLFIWWRCLAGLILLSCGFFLWNLFRPVAIQTAAPDASRQTVSTGKAAGRPPVSAPELPAETDSIIPDMPFFHLRSSFNMTGEMPPSDSFAEMPAPQQFPDTSLLFPGLPSKWMVSLHEAERQPRPSLLLSPHGLPGFQAENDSWQWYWGVNVGAALFRPVTRASGDGNLYIHKDYTAIRRQFEVGLLNQSLRLQTAAVKGKWMFTGGIGLQRQAVQASYDFEYREVPVIDQDGRILAYAGANPQRISFASRHYTTFAEIPVSMALRWMVKRDATAYMRVSASGVFLGSIRGILPDPVLLNRQEQLSPVNYQGRSLSVGISLPWLLKTGAGSRLEITPEWKWHSGLRQAQGHYLSRYNQAGLSCAYYIRF